MRVYWTADCIFRTNQDSVPVTQVFICIDSTVCQRITASEIIQGPFIIKTDVQKVLCIYIFFLLLNVVAIIQDMYAHYCLINIWYIIFNHIVYNQRLSYSLLWEGFCTLVSTFVLVFHLVFLSVSINMMIITSIQRKMKT